MAHPPAYSDAECGAPAAPSGIPDYPNQGWSLAVAIIPIPFLEENAEFKRGSRRSSKSFRSPVICSIIKKGMRASWHSGFDPGSRRLLWTLGQGRRLLTLFSTARLRQH